MTKAQPKMTKINTPKAAAKVAAKVEREGGAFTDGFANFVSRLGQRTDNVNSAGLYIFDLLTRNRNQLEAMYRGSWIVGAVVDSTAEDMTRAGIDITTNEGAENVEDLQNELSDLGIWVSLANLIRWGSLYGGAMAVLQIEGQKLDTELDYETITKDQFQGLSIYDRWQVNPDLNDLIQSGPDIGLPKYYQLVGLGGGAGTGTVEAGANNLFANGVRVHHSRVIRKIGIQLPSWQAQTEQMWGESVIERLWDRLNSFDTATLSAAQLINRAYLRTVQVEGLREILSAGGPAERGLISMFEYMRELQTNEGLTLLDAKDTFTSTAYSFAGLSDMMVQFAQQISGATGIPLVRLFGQSPAGLNATGDSDIRLYYDRINAMQNAGLRAGITKILKCIYRSRFDETMPDDLRFKFTPLWQMSATDQATVAKTVAETVSGVMAEGIIDRATAMKELRQASAETGLFTNITDEQITEAEAEPPMPPPGMGQGDDPDATPESDIPSFGKDSLKGVKAMLKRWTGR